MSVMICSAMPGGDESRRRELALLCRSLAAQAGEVWILFYGDGIYNLLAGTETAAEVLTLPATVCAVGEDAEARGMAGRLDPAVRTVTYREVADMVFRAEKTVSCV